MRRKLDAAMFVITLAAIVVLLYNDFVESWHPRGQSSPAPVLTVSPWRDKLQLKWNATSDADRAEVLIADGGRNTRISLPADAVHNGNIVYAAQSADVGFEFRSYGASPQVASIRFIGSPAVAAVHAPEVHEFPAPVREQRTAPEPEHDGMLRRMRHRFAKLWLFHHNGEDGGRH